MIEIDAATVAPVCKCGHTQAQHNEPALAPACGSYNCPCKQFRPLVAIERATEQK